MKKNPKNQQLNNSEIEILKAEIQEIKSRNAKKDLDKAWEVSYFRKSIIVLLTYIVMTLFMGSIGVEDPEINAVVPTLGFILSTFSLSVIRRFWEKAQNN